MQISRSLFFSPPVEVNTDSSIAGSTTGTTAVDLQAGTSDLAASSSLPGSFIHQGKALLDQGDLEGARKEFESALLCDDETDTAHYQLGKIYRLQNKDDLAKSHLEQALLSERYSALASFELQQVALHYVTVAEQFLFTGKLVHDTGEPIDAKMQLEKALLIDPQQAVAHARLGELFRLEGKLDQAKIYLEKAITLGLNDFLAYGSLGDILSHQNDLIGAKVYFEKALELFPEYGFAHARLGDVLRLQGDMINAKKHLERALTICSDDTFAKAVLDTIFLPSDPSQNASLVSDSSASNQHQTDSSSSSSSSIEHHPYIPPPPSSFVAIPTSTQIEYITAKIDDFLKQNQPVVCIHFSTEKRRRKAFGNEEALFVVNALRSWWQNIGKVLYSNAADLFIIVHLKRNTSILRYCRAWKEELEKFSKEVNLRVHSSHNPDMGEKFKDIIHTFMVQNKINATGKEQKVQLRLIGKEDIKRNVKGLIQEKMDSTLYSYESNKKQTIYYSGQEDSFCPKWNFMIHPISTEKTPDSKMLKK